VWGRRLRSCVDGLLLGAASFVASTQRPREQ
jgi:hypothetical protein